MNHKFWLFLLLLIHLLLMVFSIQHKTLTYDEPYHYQYGYNFFYFNSTRLSDEKMPYFSDSKMPFSCLNVVPGELRNLISPPPSEQEEFLLHLVENIQLGRYITMLFSLLLALYIYRWTYELYGHYAAFFVLLLYSFSPNIIAHARLVTTDMYAISLITIALYYFWRLTKNFSWENALLSATTLGIAQLTKYTALYLYPLFLLIVLISYSTREFGFIREKNYHALVEDVKKAGKTFLIFLFVNLLIINAGFLFNGSFRPLQAYQFKSDRFQSLQQHFQWAQKLPIPLPAPFIEGLDWITLNDETGISFGNIYLLGKLQQTNTEQFVGFKGYYLIASLFKLPIATQLFILIAIIWYILHRHCYNFLKNEIYLIVPVLGYGIYFNFFHKTQIGIRHFLVIIPLLYIFAGNFIKYWDVFHTKTKIFLGMLAIYFTLSVLSYYPHYLSYFNEFVWDRKKAYKILADSNIDWDQNKKYLAQYLSKNRDVLVNPPGPVAGKILVRVNDFVGVSAPLEKYQWLREHYEPTDHIAYSYLIFDIPK